METIDYLALAVREEADLVWRDDPLRYPYLRQRVWSCTSRTRPIGRGDSWSRGVRLVGYAVLRPQAPRQTNYWLRRAFWCKQADRDGSRSDPPAREAVDPRVIRPRVLTPWLFEDLYLDYRVREPWLVARRRGLGLGEGCTVSSSPRPPRT